MVRKLIFTIAVIPVISFVYSQERLSIHLELFDASLQTILRHLEIQSAYSFVYNETVNLNHRKRISIKNESLNTALDIIFSETGIRWNINKRHIILTSVKQETPRLKVTISGYITDAESSEALIGANVFDRINGLGTVTNDYGFYSLTVPAGKIDLQFSYTGYETKYSLQNTETDTKLNVSLNTNTMLEEVVVYGNKAESGNRGTQMSAIDVSLGVLKNTPSLLGEADLMKAMQIFPGVQAGTEGSASIHVRGGGPDENLILLDGIPLYNVDHVFGFFSIFTPEAVKKVSLYKGSFPARFGGRLSSVIDVRTNEGDLYQYHGTVGIGLLSSKLQLEGPVWKGRTSFNVSARRSYLDLIARPFMDDDKYGYYFYDLNAKLNHKFNDKSRLFFSYYNGRDKLDITIRNNYSSDLYLDDISKLNWGNTLVAARWNYIFSPKLFSNTTAAFTDYSFVTESKWYEYLPGTSDNTFISKYRSGIKDWAYRVDFEYYPLPSHHVKFGVGYLYHNFKPETEVTRIIRLEDGVVNDSIYTGVSNSHIYANEISVYAEDDIVMTSRLRINAGLHFSLFNVHNIFYKSLQPRFSARYQLTDDIVIKASYSKMSQYIHLLSSYTLTLPNDLWVPATRNIRPMRSYQYALGSYYEGFKGWELSVELYYKDMRNVLEYKDGATFLGASHNWEEKVEIGRARAYGVEFMVQKKLGSSTGLLAYTLAKSERKFGKTGINRGEWFPYRYDRRHHVNMTFNHKFSDRFDIGATWEFYTGGATTLGEEMTVIIYPDGFFEETAFIEKRNNYRLPSSHRLNLGFNIRKKKKDTERIWNIGIYNVYNAMNPTFIYRDYKLSEYNDHFQNRDNPILKKVTILPIVPSVSFTYKF